MNDKRKVGRPKGPDTVRLETRIPRQTKRMLEDLAAFHGRPLGAIIQITVDEYWFEHEFRVSTNSASTDTVEDRTP